MNENVKDIPDGCEVSWKYDSNEWCEFVILEGFMLTLRVVNLSNHSLECIAVLTSCSNWEQERHKLNGKCLSAIKREVLVWARKKIVEINEYVGDE
ncbi:hypothetical protein TUM4438_10840 [Shewanella sairae]|uniref:DUF1488 domain-containing protein n=1 Tax=Shewanella sairae TaxID=190310 RepID=A0ABQ4P611_9GAMM|nr:hypothetical protein [Shewanella sairae]MCL1130517.1 hypothetical protein [Shewanella sairae]GIU42982.1 hypothetical protein TUM4438_10840 [Shewanella sairae]